MTALECYLSQDCVLYFLFYGKLPVSLLYNGDEAVKNCCLTTADSTYYICRKLGMFDQTAHCS